MSLTKFLDWSVYFWVCLFVYLSYSIFNRINQFCLWICDKRIQFDIQVICKFFFLIFDNNNNCTHLDIKLLWIVKFVKEYSCSNKKTTHFGTITKWEAKFECLWVLKGNAFYSVQKKNFRINFFSGTIRSEIGEICDFFSLWFNGKLKMWTTTATTTTKSVNSLKVPFPNKKTLLQYT